MGGLFGPRSAGRMMLRCNMNAPTTPLALDSLLADLELARKNEDLGRLAFLAYCEVRRWARGAGKTALANHASELVVSTPHPSRDNFLEQIDLLILELGQVRSPLTDPQVSASLPSRTRPSVQGTQPG